MVYCISGILINENISYWRILLRNFRRLMMYLIVKSSMATESIISNFRDFLHFIQRSEQINYLFNALSDILSGSPPLTRTTHVN